MNKELTARIKGIIEGEGTSQKKVGLILSIFNVEQTIRESKTPLADKIEKIRESKDNYLDKSQEITRLAYIAYEDFQKMPDKYKVAEINNDLISVLDRLDRFDEKDKTIFLKTQIAVYAFELHNSSLRIFGK